MKRLAWFLVLLIIITFCTVATAETEKVYTATIGITNSTVRSAPPVEKEATVSLRPARGSTIETFAFGNYSSTFDWNRFIDLKSGKAIKNISFTYYGYYYFRVESGSSWIEADRYGKYVFHADENPKNTARSGCIAVYDSRGVVFRFRITQSGNVDIVSLKQLSGANHDREVRIQTTRVKGVNGKVIHYFPKGVFCDSVPVKYTKSTIWFHKNRPVNKKLCYGLHLYKVIAGRRCISPIGITVKYITLTH